MSLSADQLTLVRSWVGDAVETSVLDERFDRHLGELGDEDDAMIAAIEEELRHQKAVLTLDQPESIRLPDGLAVNFGKNIDGVKESIDSLRSSRGMRVSKMFRPDVR